MLQELTVKDFVQQTADNTPVPGGGSVSALLGSLGAALASMVASLTIGKKGYENCDEACKEILKIMSLARASLVQSIDDDSTAFDGVMAAFKLPRDTEENKQARKQAINKATIHAANVPLTTAKLVEQIFPSLLYLAANGNKNALSDVAVAAMCARTAILGAAYNVEINLNSLPDDGYKTETKAQLIRLRTHAQEQENKILAAITL